MLSYLMVLPYKDTRAQRFTNDAEGSKLAIAAALDLSRNSGVPYVIACVTHATRTDTIIVDAH